jgi:hypothetical protein
MEHNYRGRNRPARQDSHRGKYHAPSRSRWNRDEQYKNRESNRTSNRRQDNAFAAHLGVDEAHDVTNDDPTDPTDNSDSDDETQGQIQGN